MKALRSSLLSSVSTIALQSALQAQAVLRDLGHSADDDACPVCAERMNPDDRCATDIELGTCHAACLEDAPVVDLETGEPIDGPASIYLYGDVS